MSSRPPRRYALLASIGIPIVILVGLVAYVAWLGWLGGPVFKSLPAGARAPARIAGTSAVFFSGDMGFNTGMGPRIAARLVAAGIPVLGVNSLTAYRHERDDAKAISLVTEATRRALAIPGTRRVLLVGQSFGANALLEGIDGLPVELRRRIPAVVLIVPGANRSRQATPGGALDFLLGSPGPSLPDAHRLNWLPVLCIHGSTERDSLCPAWSVSNVRRLTLPGGHFLDEDDGAVARAILADLAGSAGNRRSAPERRR